MPPDPLIDEDEEYASSEDSDFAPEAGGDQVSEHSDSDDDAEAKPSKPTKVDDTEDAGYNNSGDEAIIHKGNKRRKRARAKGEDIEDEGGEGGLIKTRRQRAAEKEERKYAVNPGPVTVDIDAVWAQMLTWKSASKPDHEQDTGKPVIATTDGSLDATDGPRKPDSAGAADDASAMIRIKRTYNFAGRVHTEEKLVARDSAEAKLYLASMGGNPPVDETPAKRITRKAFRSAFEPVTDIITQRADLNLGMAARLKASRDAQAKKLNTVEKSRMDWAGYVDKEGIKDELTLAGKSKESYAARTDFLARSEARRDEDSRRARMAGRV